MQVFISVHWYKVMSLMCKGFVTAVGLKLLSCIYPLVVHVTQKCFNLVLHDRTPIILHLLWMEVLCSNSLSEIFSEFITGHFKRRTLMMMMMMMQLPKEDLISLFWLHLIIILMCLVHKNKPQTTSPSICYINSLKVCKSSYWTDWNQQMFGIFRWKITFTGF